MNRFKRRLSPECVDCHASNDDAEHTIFVCDRWWQKRRNLEVEIGYSFEVDSFIESILKTKKNWRAVKALVGRILKKKEE